MSLAQRYTKVRSRYPKLTLSYIHTYVCIYIYIPMYVSIIIYIYMYLCLYIMHRYGLLMGLAIIFALWQSILAMEHAPL